MILVDFARISALEPGKIIVNGWGWKWNPDGQWLDQSDKVAGPEPEARWPKKLSRAPSAPRILNKGPKNILHGVCNL